MTTRSLLLSDEEIREASLKDCHDGEIPQWGQPLSRCAFEAGARFVRSICEDREKLWLELLNNSCLFAVCSAAGVLTHETTVGRIAELRASLGIDKEGA